MEYLNIFFNDFMGRQVQSLKHSRTDPALRFNQKYLYLCSEDWNLWGWYSMGV